MAELIIAKHRNGPIGTVKLAFLNHYPKFADKAHGERPLEQRPGEGPPMSDLPPAAAAADPGPEEDFPGGEFAEDDIAGEG